MIETPNHQGPSQVGRGHDLMRVLPDHATGVSLPAFGDVETQIVQKPTHIARLRDIARRIVAKPANAVDRAFLSAAPFNYVGRFKVVIKPVDDFPNLLSLPMGLQLGTLVLNRIGRAKNAMVTSGQVIPHGRFKSDIHKVPCAARRPFFAVMMKKRTGSTAQSGSDQVSAGHLSKEKHCIDSMLGNAAIPDMKCKSKLRFSRHPNVRKGCVMRNSVIATILSVFLPIPLSADPISEGPYAIASQAVTACMESPVFSDNPNACAGVSYQGCIDRLGAKSSHSDEADCLVYELWIWRQHYQTEALRMLSYAKSLDDDAALTGQRSIHAFRTSLRAEQQWQELLVSDCMSEMNQWGAGNIKMTELPYCEMRKTISRIVYLRALLSERKYP